MKRSESISELSKALAKAQCVMAGAAKDSSNPFFCSKYADLASCWAAWRPAGPPNGLALMQFVTAAEERLDPPIQVQADGDRKAKTIHFIQRVSVETLLCHGDQWVSETLTVLVKDDSPQSTILGETYCRRGGMCAVIGIAPEDDDGDSAANHGAESGERRTAERNPPCPNCGKPDAVIKGKAEYGGGWVCFTKKGGCGEKWQDPTPADAAKKAEVERLAAEHGLNTGDKLAPPAKPPYETAKHYLALADTVEKANKLAEWCEKEHVARRLEAAQHDELALAIAEKLHTVCNIEADFVAADAQIKGFVAKMRISDPVGTKLRIDLDLDKEAKFGVVA